MSVASKQDLVEALIDRRGRTYAAEAGIRLRPDPKPSPLYRLLCLATLLGARIRAPTAVEASRALSRAGWRTARSMAASGWEDRVRVLNRSGYARYDESTARMLGESAELLLDRWNGDLRRLRSHADGDVTTLRSGLTEAKGVGEISADIFCREVQGAWPEVAPFLDGRTMQVAEEVGLGTKAMDVAGLVVPGRLPELTAALIRTGLEGDTHDIRSRVRRGSSR